MPRGAILLLLAPTGALVALLLVRLRRPASRPGSGAVLGFLACVAVSAATQPVLVTTASGLETQAFVLVYFLGFAFLVEEAARRAVLLRRGADRASPPPSGP